MTYERPSTGGSREGEKGSRAVARTRGLSFFVEFSRKSDRCKSISRPPVPFFFGPLSLSFSLSLSPPWNTSPAGCFGIVSVFPNFRGKKRGRAEYTITRLRISSAFVFVVCCSLANFF